MRKTAMLILILGTLAVVAACQTSKQNKKKPADVISSKTQPEIVSSIQSVDESSFMNFKIIDQGGNVIITAEHLESVDDGELSENNGWYMVTLKLSDTGSELFRYATEQNLGKQLHIYVDDVLVCSPVVNEAITDGIIVISGLSTYEEANELYSMISEAMHGK